MKYYPAVTLLGVGANMAARRKKYTFIDLFAGIGGIRLAFKRAGATCVFSSEWDPYACKTYEANFHETPAGDIRDIDEKDIPDHDILTAGFPCQPFSIAGVSKHNALGRPHGFRHATQGTMFFEVERILAEKRPKAIFLENVKNLLSHDRGRTFQVIRGRLEKLGYRVYYDVIGADKVLPQRRNRVYIVGFLDQVEYSFPKFRDLSPSMEDILEPDVPDHYTISRHLWRYLRDYAKKHKSKGNGFGFGLVGSDDIARTLSARYHKDGGEILVSRGPRHNPRRLTPRECARLMGFPDSYKIVCSDTRAYQQFGNSVAVPIVQKIAKSIVQCLDGKTIYPTEPHQCRLLESAQRWSAGGRRTIRSSLGAKNKLVGTR